MNNICNTDVLIIGAGLAGSVLAYRLRQHGLRVILAERGRLDTLDKLCAGALDESVEKSFEGVFGPDSISSIGLHTACWRTPSCVGASIQGDVPFATVSRKRLDDYCRVQSISAGARILERTAPASFDLSLNRAELHDLRQKSRLAVRYRALVGADGAYSATRRLVTGRPPRVCPAFQYTIECARDIHAMEFKLGVEGYCWYFSQGEQAAVGACVMGDTASPRDVRAWLAAFSAQLGIEMRGLRGAPIPSGDDVLLRYGPNVWFVGDAAGLITDLGGGIHYAIESAVLLADSLAGGKPYEDAMAPTVAEVTGMARSIEVNYFMRCMQIVHSGTAHKGTPPK